MHRSMSNNITHFLSMLCRGVTNVVLATHVHTYVCDLLVGSWFSAQFNFAAAKQGGNFEHKSERNSIISGKKSEREFSWSIIPTLDQ